MAPIERWEVVKREGYWIRDRVTGVERETGNGRAWAEDCARVANAKEDEYMRAELDATREEAFEEVDRLAESVIGQGILVYNGYVVERRPLGFSRAGHPVFVPFTEALKAAANPKEGGE